MTANQKTSRQHEQAKTTDKDLELPIGRSNIKAAGLTKYAGAPTAPMVDLGWPPFASGCVKRLELSASMLKPLLNPFGDAAIIWAVAAMETDFSEFLAGPTVGLLHSGFEQRKPERAPAIHLCMAVNSALGILRDRISALSYETAGPFETSPQKSCILEQLRAF